METYRILAEGQAASNDARRTGLNNNDLVIGPPGAGKTRGYVMPNIMQCAESLIVADTKGALHHEMEGLLQGAGYEVRRIDFAGCALSPCGYNPLDCIGMEGGRPSAQDVMTLAACLVPIESYRDPYWELSARMYLESVAAYVLECLPRDEWRFSSIGRLLPELGAKGRYRRMIDELEGTDSDSLAVGRYRLVQAVAEGTETTHSCTQGVLASKLSALLSSDADALCRNPNRIRFGDIGSRKTAVFLTISDTDSSMYRLVGAFYAQALHALCRSADASPGHRLAVPVRLILDDFAANVCIPDFDRITSVIRSRGISVSIILQSLSQLDDMYGRAKACTIINNCDSCLYLGGQDVGTARYVAAKANKPASAILSMPIGSAWLFRRGEPPKAVKRYDVTSHEKYGMLPEGREADVEDIEDRIPFE